LRCNLAIIKSTECTTKISTMADAYDCLRLDYKTLMLQQMFKWVNTVSYTHSIPTLTYEYTVNHINS
jgi:hypothetical protein